MESTGKQATTHPRRRKAAIVGMFDGVHLGHRFLIDRLKREASIRGMSPSVFTFPSHPLTVVNPAIAPRLLSTPEEKLSLLAGTGIRIPDIGFILFDEELRNLHAADFLGMLHDRYDVDFILRGFNNRFGTERNLSGDDYRRIAADCGIELVEADSLPFGDGENPLPVSSSRIRQDIEEGNIEGANLMSGHPYRLTGTVVGGKRLGRTIGFPTANISVPHSAKLIPARGVYICVAEADGSRMKAMVNIGLRPTVDGPGSAQTIEAHIIDFNGDIYGKEVTLEFHKRLRDEILFSSPAELADRLEADRRITRRFVIPPLNLF